jgi:hypothetical protein
MGDTSKPHGVHVLAVVSLVLLLNGTHRPQDPLTCYDDLNSSALIRQVTCCDWIETVTQCKPVSKTCWWLASRLPASFQTVSSRLTYTLVTYTSKIQVLWDPLFALDLSTFLIGFLKLKPS